MAAGRGTRLGGLTEALPKPMLPVGGRPVVAWLLDLLARSGVREVLMNLHHRPEALREYCGDGSQWGLRITYAYEPTLLGTAGTVRNFASHLGGAPFFVAYGDNYFDCKLAELLEFHHERRALATIGLFEKDDVTGSGTVRLDPTGRVIQFIEKPRQSEAPSRLVNGGLYVLSPEILPMVPAVVPCDFGYDVFPALLAAGAPVYGRVLPGAVWAIDTPELFRALSERMAGES
ncbi:MAG: nucleotidyltransferase family protein [Candidatus Rokubacteria bacterium]|nr:nucleotidyltransferase family protein [Candidatus Rokubacteria bacterium]